MYSARKKIIFITACLSLLAIAGADTILAQSDSYGLAVPLVNIDGEVSPGSVICSDTQDYKMCDNEYDNNIIGVSTDNPSSSLQINSLESSTYLLASGMVIVRAANTNGQIQSGDLITSSQQQGVAMKATQNGLVLGSAVDSLEGEEGRILVAVNIHQTTAFTNSRNLIELLRKGLAAAVLTPLEALRYMLAAVVTVSSFILAFVYYGRVSKSGVEAIGRNPLARNAIQASILLHLVITVIICLAGFAIAYLILAI